MSGNNAFMLVEERGWRRGLRNMLQSELAGWWKTSLWWVQALIWGGMMSFILGSIFLQGGDLETVDAVMLYSVFGGLFPAVAVIIILMGAVVGEKQDGTASWVLSKPVARPAFIIAKLLAHSLGVFVTMVLIPGLLAYLILTMLGGIELNPVPFITAQFVFFLNHLFFLSLTLMLGTLFAQRGPVIGIALAILFMQQNLIGMLSPLKHVLPWTLVMPMATNSDALVPALLLGEPIPSVLHPVIILLEIVVFIAIGLMRFNNEEL